MKARERAGEEGATAQSKGSRAKGSSKKRVIRLTSEGAQIFSELRERFERKFGHLPGPGESMFFEAEVDELGPIDQERFDAVMISAMQAAGVDPAMIYAYRSTGILISEQNLHQRSKVDRRRWQAAVEEYEEQSRPWT